MTPAELTFAKDGLRMQASALGLFIASVKSAGAAYSQMSDADAAAIAEITRQFGSDLERVMADFQRNIETLN